jgi:hypothetical protein
VQASPSLHGIPSGAAVLLQAPVTGSQAPARWHESTGTQTTGLPLLHAPPRQTSFCVHASPSLQGVPSGLTGFEHMPVAGSHAGASWHGPDAGHTTGFPPAQAPPTHESVWVHALPSLHGVPSGRDA